MTDPDREVHQGTGWFLREAWKLNRGETEKFLMKHRNTAPRLIMQYATEKMTKDERLKFRRDK
jgi:3-methyladenine DNA glycosylase AlkD